MGNLTSGMLWLTRPGDRAEKRLTEAVEYAEGKYGPVEVICYPEGESYPHLWHAEEPLRDIPLRPDRRVLAHHLYLVLDEQAEPAG